MNWEENWKIKDDKVFSGGQGSIRKVININNESVGALKELHPEHLKSTERRFRFHRETNVLLMLDGKYTPKVIEHNVNSWQDASEKLWVIMQWIEGPTLTEFIQRNGNLCLDDAICVTLELIDALNSFHKLNVLHRDIKPDNIILLNQNINNPVLVDFGLAYFDEEDFKSKLGQELGNRFLRMPELSAGSSIKAQATDLTMLLGVLFYVLTGVAPRQLQDFEGKLPHERNLSIFTEDTLSDLRWSKLKRIFYVGFQPRLELRFQNCESLRNAIMNIDPNENEGDEFINDIENLRATIENSDVAYRTEISNKISKLTEKLSGEFSKYLSQAGLVAYGSSGFQETDLIHKVHFGIHRPEIPKPVVVLHHKIEATLSEIALMYKIDNDEFHTYYNGSVADVEGFTETALTEIKHLFRLSIESFRMKLEK
ncbi:protein kinase domain-containing protein [Prolixibacter denitrificans]|uniref:Serine/threonine-protein kinase n=1 Tax=Prolixibacter denitrificans TaxID=1541063 RepID=A0A2P8CFB7_9BACT|nr:protein kinase [Prolixibacter denitrificans]PSK83636.1 serine/threonine-protein kinase [Prolixibacter denitrificans]GET23185.1 hypothetical protein JCM18694_34310 [Prolixibacter denitrificans]